jgi:phosphoadenosine phosphosulfate reductase
MDYADDARFIDLTDAAASLIESIAADHSPAAFACSFGAEDMVLLDLIAGHGPGIEVLTLDTGRLPPETLDLLARARDRYGIDIRVVRPDRESVERYVRAFGVDGFYEGVQQRRACCDIRKVQPLARALSGKRAWITGMRRDQSDGRAHIAITEAEPLYGLSKFNPLAAWTTADVWTYVRANHVPYNPLHDRGYPSIGCAPCTRAIRPGEPLRAGRWWWERTEVNKECGLHRVSVRVEALERHALEA